jgi:hypothetical protein
MVSDQHRSTASSLSWVHLTLRSLLYSSRDNTTLARQELSRISLPLSVLSLTEFNSTLLLAATLPFIVRKSLNNASAKILMFASTSWGQARKLKQFFLLSGVPHAYINCVECSTPRTIFESVLNQVRYVFRCSSSQSFSNLGSKISCKRNEA